MRKKREYKTDIALAMGRHVYDSGPKLLLIAVLIQAIKDIIQDSSLDAELFVLDDVVRRNYCDIYSIRDLPNIAMERYNAK